MSIFIGNDNKSTTTADLWNEIIRVRKQRDALLAAAKAVSYDSDESDITRAAWLALQDAIAIAEEQAP